jgi:hypothetical protein
MAIVRGLTADHAKTIGFVGAGAVLGGIAQGSGILVAQAGENIRDVVIVGVAMAGMSWGGQGMRSVAAGFGAAGVVGLVARNFPALTSVGG